MNPRIAQMSGVMLKALSAADQDALIDLWELDLRLLGGGLHRFCSQVNEKSGAVLWKGQQYEPFPISAEGFDMSGQGAGNRPKITVSNLFGFVTGVAEQFGQLVGAGVTRRQTYARFLDAGNFINGNAQADPTQEVVSKYLVERLASMNAEVAVFELAAPSEADGATIPSRLMLANVCCWEYRGEGCGYTGRAVADRFDMRTDDPAKDDCSRGYLGCCARFGATAVLPIGAFLSADKVLS